MRFVLLVIFLTTFQFNIFGQYELDDFDKIELRNFPKIRRHISKVNSDNSSSIAEIAYNIESIAISDLEKAYASFFWVSTIITYDMRSYESNISVPYKPQEVLNTKLAV